MIKINFYGGPGSGKSTVAALLFSELKVHGFRTELVREAAKDFVYEGYDLRESGLDLQLVIFGEQLKRELLLEKQVDFMVSDSPLFLNAHYANQEYLKQVAMRRNSKKDLHIWIERDPNEKFENEGRSHTEAQSLKIDQKMKDYLEKECGLELIILKGTAKEKSSFIVNKIIRDQRVNKKGKKK